MSGRVVVQEWVSLDGFASGAVDEMAIMGAVDGVTDARSQEFNAGLIDAAAFVRRFRADGDGVLIVWGSLQLTSVLMREGPTLSLVLAENWGTVAHLRYRLTR